MNDIIHTFIKYNPLWFLQPLLILVRLVACIYCITAASEHKKNKVKWGALGFFVPLIAIGWILFVFPKTDDNKEQADAVIIDTP